MKNERWEHDAFDALLRDALASDAAPSEDFTARVMEQVRRTPQEKPRKAQPVIRVLAALAACAVIVVAIPLVRMSGGMGSAAPESNNMADCAAAPETDDATAGDPADKAPVQQFVVGNGVDENGDNGSDGSQKMTEREETTGELAHDTDQALTLVGQDARDAMAVLMESGIQPETTENGRSVYVLTAEQAAKLGESVDALYGIEGSLTLTLEAAE